MGINKYIYGGIAVIIGWLTFDNYIKSKEIENLSYKLLIETDEKNKAHNAFNDIKNELNKIATNRDEINKQLDIYKKQSVSKFENIDKSLVCEKKLEAYLNKALQD